MLIQLLDDIAYRSKRFSVFCSGVLGNVLNLRYRDDLLLLGAAVIASSFWQFENYYHWAGILKMVSSAFALLMWLYVSFISGFNRRESFVFVILGYWFLPQIILIGISSYHLVEYNMILYLLSIVSNIMVHSPVMIAESRYGINWHIIVVSVVILCELFFAFGYNLRYSLRRSKWYCDFRKHMQKSKRSRI